MSTGVVFIGDTEILYWPRSPTIIVGLVTIESTRIKTSWMNRSFLDLEQGIARPFWHRRLVEFIDFIELLNFRSCVPYAF